VSKISDHPLADIGSVVISDASPCGENVRYDSDFEQLEAELAKQESLSSATVDWAKVITLSSSITQNNSKDILIGSYLQQISLKIKPLQQLAFIVYQNKSFVQNEVKNMK
jgi:type VI secretion system protein VasJ